MDTIFMNSGNSKTSEPYVLIPKLTDKLDLRRGEKSIALSNDKLINLNYHMSYILYQMFQTILSIFKKKKMKTLIIHQ